MIICPTCHALLVQVKAMPGVAGQFICSCARSTWVYRGSGDLERVEAPARRSSRTLDG